MARTKSTARHIPGPSSPTPPTAIAHPPTAHLPEHVITSTALLAFPIGTVVLSSLLPSDPIKVLSYSLPAIALLQSLNILLTSPSPAPVAKSTAGKKKKQANSTVSTTILGLVLTALLTPAIHIIYILFGAPVTVSILATFLLSAHTAILALFPLLCTVPLDGATWIDIVALQAPVTPAYTAALGTIAGAWLGAVPIPLDWDREWQTWPVTVVFGVYVGNAVGRVIGAVRGGKKKKV
ncbi:GPI biosynthesis protein family Pig-F-domain-containing protein [Lipomyces tetrasporus]|uniref:Glycosylphosphatidylinositol anchor biosynthesis protein 11 n=1 Tax=Lipomyces tetrasporus TaxID=54092 RepID=A0AAD7QNG0_9ASCO|nr:GPI biosynthesis protein family Pig-F-domain-containing protein [Lipomyces tetrasporus]KAJ8098446.1 GPI biosynthesis protein family Pig-F-domain-containing protein [Lipomyces tetrasporus]